MEGVLEVIRFRLLSAGSGCVVIICKKTHDFSYGIQDSALKMIVISVQITVFEQFRN